MYAYDFEGTRYDVGDKIGFLKATVEYALRREDLRDGFIEYLNTLKNKNKATISLGRDNFMTAVEKINFLLTRMPQ